jgi:hypothetical protein
LRTHWQNKSENVLLILNHTPQEKHQQETYSMTLFMNTELVIPTEAGLHSCQKKRALRARRQMGRWLAMFLHLLDMMM